MPGAAVIPAPIAYNRVAAVKKLVAEFWNWPIGPLEGELMTDLFFIAKSPCALC